LGAWSTILASLFTGGKDSTYATHLAEERGDRVECLVTMVSQRADSWMFHTVNIGLAEIVAKAIGKKHVAIRTLGDKERELDDLRSALKSLRVEGVVSGAIASTYQRSRVDRICDELGLKHVTPLWGRRGEALLGEMLSAGMEIVVTSVAARGLDEHWLGRVLDLQAVRELQELNERFGVDVCGDGGEFETIVLDAPWFISSLEIKKARRIWEGESGYYLIEEIESRSKDGHDA